jgi:hypothetical protein
MVDWKTTERTNPDARVSSPNIFMDKLDDLLTICSSPRFSCPSCCLSFESLTVVVREHPICKTWSCRYLTDYRAAFPGVTPPSETYFSKSIAPTTAICGLCGEERPMESQLGLRMHADSHTLRDCAQPIFTDYKGFVRHLVQNHAAVPSFLDIEWLLPWQRTQSLNIGDGQGFVRNFGTNHSFSYVRF